jgi:Rad3-related DNA helicase
MLRYKWRSRFCAHFISDRNAVIEAATGVGKSFAYVVASLAYNYLTGERVRNRDRNQRPCNGSSLKKICHSFSRALDNDLRFELCLGSANYFCRLRYEQMINEGSFRDLIEDDKAQPRCARGQMK